MGSVGLTGWIVRMGAAGLGVVRLDMGKDAFFDRFAPRASRGGGDLREGSRIVGGADRTDTEVVRLTWVEAAKDNGSRGGSAAT